MFSIVKTQPRLNQRLLAVLVAVPVLLSACTSPSAMPTDGAFAPNTPAGATSAPGTAASQLVAQGTLPAGCPSVDVVAALVGNEVVPGVPLSMDSCNYLGSLYGLTLQTQTYVPIATYRDMSNSYPNSKIVEQPALGTGAFYIYAQGAIARTNTQDELCVVFAPTKAGVAQVSVGVDNRPATGEGAICAVAISAFKKLMAK